MPKCKLCKKNATISGYCSEHFAEYFENTVNDTVKKFKLIKKSDRVLVGVSGGKDSLATLFVLKKLGYNVEGLAIDEGIKKYREYTLSDLGKFSKKHGIPFKIVSFKDEFGVTLDEAVKKLNKNPCHICGVFRRFLLNKYSRDFDVLATGHNLDDEAQAVFMNILKAQTDILTRLGPVTGVKMHSGFTKRIKPLYFLKDKEVKAYTVINGFKIGFHECPYTHSSFRASVQDELNKFENFSQGTKLGIVNHFLIIKEDIKKDTEGIKVCSFCGEPSSSGVCKSCRLAIEIKSS